MVEDRSGDAVDDQRGIDTGRQLTARHAAPIALLVVLCLSYWGDALFTGRVLLPGAMLGGYLGSHTALKFGARLIRPLLVVISLGMTARLLWGYFAS